MCKALWEVGLLSLTALGDTSSSFRQVSATVQESGFSAYAFILPNLCSHHAYKRHWCITGNSSEHASPKIPGSKKEVKQGDAGLGPECGESGNGMQGRKGMG